MWARIANPRYRKREILVHIRAIGFTVLKKAIILNPYQGIGNPEPLKHHLSGKWSRKIDKVNRFVYNVENNTLHIYSLKGHY